MLHVNIKIEGQRCHDLGRSEMTLSLEAINYLDSNSIETKLQTGTFMGQQKYSKRENPACHTEFRDHMVLCTNLTLSAVKIIVWFFHQINPPTPVKIRSIWWWKNWFVSSNKLYRDILAVPKPFFEPVTILLRVGRIWNAFGLWVGSESEKLQICVCW